MKNTRYTETDDCLTLSEMQGYLDGQLSAEEQNRVDLHLADCELCCGALEVLDSSPKNSEQNFSQAQSIYRDTLDQKEGPTVNTGYSGLIKYAAGLAVLIGIAWGIYQIAMPGERDLFASAFEPYPDVVTTRSAQAPTGVFNTGMNHYNQQEYAEAAISLDEALKQDSGLHAAFLYSAIAHLATGKPQLAEERLAVLTKNSISGFKSPAEWYLALAWIQGGKEAEAKSLLTALARNTGPYQEKARKLLESW